MSLNEIATKGVERERNMSREAYFSDLYFSLPQLCSFAHQLNFIHSMRPASAIEVGVGNGFVSSFLRLSGLHIVTADINLALEPDICAPLSDLGNLVDGPMDLVICCEVLEHMPLEELDTNIEYLRQLGSRLFMTLPNSRRSWGLASQLSLPKLGFKHVDLNFNFPFRRRLENSPHFWEVGYNSDCSRSAIEDRLKRHYSSVRSGKFLLNPYHVWFVCE